jgi:hypothetical protein
MQATQPRPAPQSIADYDVQTRRQAMLLIQAVSECIKELGTVPSGHLYAGLMGSLSLDQYNQIISAMLDMGLIKESGHLLTWIG